MSAAEDVRAFLDEALAPWKLTNADGTTLTGDMLREALDERDALQETVERLRATHTVAWESKPGLEIVCSCGALLSCYGLTTGIAGIFARHIRAALDGSTEEKRA